MEPCKLHPQQDSEAIFWSLNCTYSYKYKVALDKFWCLRAEEKEKRKNKNEEEGGNKDKI